MICSWQCPDRSWLREAEIGQGWVLPGLMTFPRIFPGDNDNTSRAQEFLSLLPEVVIQMPELRLLQSRPGNKGPRQDPVAHNGSAAKNGGHKLIKPGLGWLFCILYFLTIRLSSFAFHNCQAGIPNDFDPDPDPDSFPRHYWRTFAFALTEIRPLTGFALLRRFPRPRRFSSLCSAAIDRLL